jgi:hypothetical protein
MCGNVWQEHTINEVGGCMAIMDIDSSVALARSGKPSPNPSTVEICPVCNKLPAEHTEDELRSCVAKWRKHEKGATGLKLQGRFIMAVAKNEELDPVKRAQLRARMLQLLCSCGKAYGDHTQDEIRACAERNREKR